jgi:hypothetical protein
MYLAGNGTNKDCHEASRWFQKAAEQNYLDAQVHLARFYFFGDGTCSRNYDEAAKWAAKAATAGNTWAHNTMGFLYEHGFGVQKNETEAAEWFRKAAEKGDGKAQANLGAMYASGNGVARDLVQAYRWLKLSADQGESAGAVPLGEIKKGMTQLQIQKAEQLAQETREEIKRHPAVMPLPSAKEIR